MQNIYTKNFRFQIWFDAAPDKILLGTVSVCAEDPESALRLVKAHTSFFPTGVDNLTWQVREPVPVRANF